MRARASPSGRSSTNAREAENFTGCGSLTSSVAQIHFARPAGLLSIRRHRRSTARTAAAAAIAIARSHATELVLTDLKTELNISKNAGMKFGARHFRIQPSERSE